MSVSHSPFSLSARSPGLSFIDLTVADPSNLVLTDGVRRLHDRTMMDTESILLSEAQNKPIPNASAWNVFFKMHKFLPSECAPFARGYPKLSDDALKSVLEQAHHEPLEHIGWYPKALVSAPSVRCLVLLWL